MIAYLHVQSDFRLFGELKRQGETRVFRGVVKAMVSQSYPGRGKLWFRPWKYQQEAILNS